MSCSRPDWNAKTAKKLDLVEFCVERDIIACSKSRTVLHVRCAAGAVNIYAYLDKQKPKKVVTSKSAINK